MRSICAQLALATLACIPAFPAYAADGVCDPAESAANLCFVSPGGFVVEAVTGPNGEFPVIDNDGNSVFKYRITGPGINGGSCAGVLDISHASISFPNRCTIGDDLKVHNAFPASRVLQNGQGDSSCGFGVGDNQNDVLKWDAGVRCNEVRNFTLIMEGEVSATPRAFSIKAGPNCSSATILGPGCPNVGSYCPGNPNSTGEPAELSFDGVFSIAANDFTLLGTGLPPDQPGYFFYGSTQVDLPFGNGRRCIGGNVVRLRKIGIPVTGDSATQFDLTSPPLNTVVPGIPYHFQLYYRDPMAGGAGFSTTDALTIIFTP